MLTTAGFVDIKYPKGTVQTKLKFHQCTIHHYVDLASGDSF